MIIGRHDTARAVFPAVAEACPAMRARVSPRGAAALVTLAPARAQRARVPRRTPHLLYELVIIGGLIHAIRPSRDWLT